MSDFTSKAMTFSGLVSALMLSISLTVTPAAAGKDDDIPSSSSAKSEKKSPSAKAKAADNGLSQPKKKKNTVDDSNLPKPGKDYYSERAKKVNGGEQQSKQRQHPLHEKYPDQNIVICEAGCPGGKLDQIAFIEPKSARKPVRSSAEMVQTAATSGATANQAIECVAGCYGSTPKTYHNIPGSASNPMLKGLAPSAAANGSWVTTVARAEEAPAMAPKAPGGSGDWMKRIEQPKDTKSESAPSQPTTADRTADSAPSAEQKPADATMHSMPAIEAAKTEAAPTIESGNAVTETKPADAIAPVEQAKSDEPAPTSAPTTAEATAESKATDEPNSAATLNTEAPTIAPASEMVAKSEATPASSGSAPAPAQVAEAASASPSDQQKPSSEIDPLVKKDLSSEAAPASEQTADAAPAAPAPAEAPAAASQTETALNSDASNEGSDLKTASDMAAALDQAKTTAEKAAAISEAKPSEASTAVSDAKMAEAPAASSPQSPKIISGADPAAASDDKPMQMAAADAMESQSAKAPITSSSNEVAVDIDSGDPDFDAAVQKARLSLPEFWSKFDAPSQGETDFSLKVEISDAASGLVEHFWLTDIMRKDGKIIGIISNDPQAVKTVSRGQVYEIDPEKISDWLFKRNGKTVGNETMRPLLKNLPPEQAASFRSMYETP